MYGMQPLIINLSRVYLYLYICLSINCCLPLKLVCAFVAHCKVLTLLLRQGRQAISTVKMARC